jgi:hypothetical protein
MGSEVIGMGLKASGARLVLIIANVNVQRRMYLKWASACVKMNQQMISYTETLMCHLKFLLPFLHFVRVAFLLIYPFEERLVRSLL